MNLYQRLLGCPSGATLHALLLCGHTRVEIDEAVDTGRVEREVRRYANPVGEVEWFVANRKENCRDR
jgi:hypothetical protein